MKNKNNFEYILKKYNKKIKDEEDKKQFKFTLSKYMFFIAVVILIFKFVYFSIYSPSILEVYLSFGHTILFFTSLLIFLNAFIGVDKSCDDDYGIYFDDE